MSYSGLIDFQIDTDITTEPVTLADVKRHLNMLFDTDGSYVFTDDDVFLNGQITASRMMLEEYTGLSFAPKTITAELNNCRGCVEIPFGPVTSITTMTDVNGNAVNSSNYKLMGLRFQSINYPVSDYLRITYVTGYAVLPGPLKLAICEDVAFHYNHRGDESEVGAYCKSAFELAAPYKRTSWVV